MAGNMGKDFIKKFLQFSIENGGFDRLLNKKTYSGFLMKGKLVNGTGQAHSSGLGSCPVPKYVSTYDVQITAGGNGALSAIMKVEQEHLNRGGFLHGAMTTLLVDSLSTVGMMTHPNAKSPGVSLNINMQYMKAVSVGGEILIKTSTEKVGSRLAYLTVDIMLKSTGEMVAKGTHTKFVG